MKPDAINHPEENAQRAQDWPFIFGQFGAVTGLVGNCALCGKARSDLQLHSVVNGAPQYLGKCCWPKSL